MYFTLLLSNYVNILAYIQRITKVFEHFRSDGMKWVPKMFRKIKVIQYVKHAYYLWLIRWSFIQHVQISTEAMKFRTFPKLWKRADFAIKVYNFTDELIRNNFDDEPVRNNSTAKPLSICISREYLFIVFFLTRIIVIDFFQCIGLWSKVFIFAYWNMITLYFVSIVFAAMK